MKIWVLLLAVSGLLFSGQTVQAQQWQQHGDAMRSRIIAASLAESGNEKLWFAWEAELRPGWKTYWRSPGEAGLPLIIKTGTDKIDPMFPWPERFEFYGIETYGYSDLVVIPFSLPRSVLGQTVELSASFMACKEVCIPFEAAYVLDTRDLEDVAAIADIKIAGWMEKVPHHVSVQESPVSIEQVKVTGRPGQQKLVIQVRSDHRLDRADLIAEAPNGFHMIQPERRLIGDGLSAIFVMDVIAGASLKDLNRVPITLTFNGGQGDLFEFHLDPLTAADR